jgi:hypothetical protein
MQDNESVSLTAEGNNGNIELTKTSLKINEYKKGLMGWNKSKIDKVHEIPRDAITEARVSQKEMYVFVSEVFPDVDPSGYFTISFNEYGGPWQDFKNIAEEIGLQGYWYEDNSKLSHIESYESEEQASIDVDGAAKKGWKALGSSATDGHINIGRTLARGLIFGAHRTKGTITITYDRTPEWLASHNKSQPSAPTPQPAEDPLQKMKQLKGMLDAGLISESEYNAKKADLLSKM